MRSPLALLLLSALTFAATHNGDGTFQLFLNQSIESHIHYTVLLTGIGRAGGLGDGQAGFAIYAPDGTAADSAVLDENGTYNASFPGDGGRITGRLLSIRLYGTGYGSSPDGSSQPYARVKVSSANLGSPANLSVSAPDIWPRTYDATISWETNDGANSTAYIYDSSSHLVNYSSDGASSEFHSIRVSGLEPDTAYFVVVESCDLDCVRSAPLGMRTLGGENRSAETGNEPPNQEINKTKNKTSSATGGFEDVPAFPEWKPLAAVGALSALAVFLLRK